MTIGSIAFKLETETATETGISTSCPKRLIPIVTVVGIQCGVLLGGTVLVETVFAIPGLGKLMVDSIKAKDYPMVQGGVLFIALVFCLINLLVDVLYAYIDPRIKSQYQAGKRPKKG